MSGKWVGVDCVRGRLELESTRLTQEEAVLIIMEAAPGLRGAPGSAKLKSLETIIKGGGVGLSCLHRVLLSTLASIFCC